SPQVLEATDAEVNVRDGVGADLVVVSQGQTLTFAVFGATVLAKSGAERILRQAQQLPECKPSEQSTFAVDCLIAAYHVFVDIAARACSLYEIVSRGCAVWKWKIVKQKLRGRIESIRRNQVAREGRARTSDCRVSAAGRIH